LVVQGAAPLATVDSGFGMLKVPSSGRPRRLDRFDPAGLLARQDKKKK
jgi:hypothetical protein